jgi:DNA recombination protein RmuC
MLPGDRVIIIDSKVALNAYVEHTKAEPEQAKQHLKDHAAAIRKHIRDLSSKDYQAKVPNETVDAVIAFIPGEHFLTAAVDVDPELLDYALSRNVVLATPHILCYLAKTVSSTWQQSQLTENAKELSKAGQAYFKRLHTLQEHLNKTGRSLNGTVSSFNAMVASFDSQFVSGARRFSELGVIGCSDLPEPTVVESRARDSIKEVPQIADGDRCLPDLRPL